MRPCQRNPVYVSEPTSPAFGSRHAADPAPSGRVVQSNSGGGVGAVASTVDAGAHGAVATRLPKTSEEGARAVRTSPEFDRREDVFAVMGRLFGNPERAAKRLEIATRHTLMAINVCGTLSAFVSPFFIGPLGVLVGLGIAVGTGIVSRLIWGTQRAS